MKHSDTRKNIIGKLEKARADANALITALTDRVLLTDYSALAVKKDALEIWTNALRKALSEHEIVVIPARDEPYYIDDKISIPSDRRIEATGAVLRQTPDCELLMLTCDSAVNGTHSPIDTAKHPRCRNISIEGGRWEECRSKRGGYGSSGKFDHEYSFHGVSTLFFFNNMEYLTIENVTFAHTAGFAVQVGDIRGAFFENIRFDSCYADGLHINGNTEDLVCKHISGQVGDDLVALNAYDWQNSSVDFGAIDTVLCDDLELSEDSRYKALRIEPGTYYYDDGSSVDCALRNAIIRSVRGIRTFKLYYQTPRYRLGEKPENGAVGSADNLFFENIDIDLSEPIDGFDVYTGSDPVRGVFAAFELGANIGYMRLENIRIKLYKKKFPLSYLVCCGPKSVLIGDTEIFDPYLSSRVRELELSGITVNGAPADNTDELVREISFDNINGDGHSTAHGKIGKIVFETND